MLSRRQFGQSLCASAALLPAASWSAPFRTIPQRASARIIVDNDFAGDPDGLVALAHQLLTPKTRTVLCTSSALDRKLVGSVPPDLSASAGKDIALDLIRRMRIADAPPVEAGSERLDPEHPESSAAARAIVAEAMRDDMLPLYISCGGPLTNVAAAIRLKPEIAKRMTLIWIGGGRYPHGSWEYNLTADLPAAKIVIEQSAIPLWQIPQNAYRQMQFSVAELQDRLRPISDFGAWLYDKFTTPPAFVDVGGSWPLGDSPTVLLSAISQESSHYVDRPALRIKPDGQYGAPVGGGRMVRVYERLDARLTFEDFLSLMRIHAAQG
ncbi:nucleoside hydrolase [Sphingobium sp. HBC34]|uniref:Nucleoside hydrolase n=1 Tax=Sphingobium cyanobacteriorum TaxID=3063954 RepID=A0ABT8ZL61_9SPHN|nr:nucleoside hydrolase [Sphingobium sp. HBC34]MDO7835279.1 nucleoside hydrolase [Sphingobium sp. HBC34]